MSNRSKILCSALVVTVVGALGVVRLWASARPTGDQTPATSAATEPKEALGCCKAAFCPKVFTFYGNEQTLLEDVEQYVESQVRGRRVYAFILETSESADVLLLEKDSPSHSNVYRWSGPTVGDLHTKLHQMLLGNRGVFCVGEGTKALLAGEFELNRESSIPTPPTARAAMLHAIRKASPAYQRLTVILLC